MMVAPEISMEQLLKTYPGAQRALFRNYHIGGCASCGFRADETLAEVCARNGNLDASQVLATIEAASEADAQMMISPGELSILRQNEGVGIFDMRTREEFDAVHIEGSRHFNQEEIQEILSSWPKDRLLVIVDHTGARSLDAAAYFAGHGFERVKCLRGGIDAWSVEVDPSLPRYTIE